MDQPQDQKKTKRSPIYRVKHVTYSRKSNENLLLVKKMSDFLPVRGTDTQAYETAERWKALFAAQYLKREHTKYIQ